MVGKKAAAYEKAFGLTTVGDLLRHYPRRFYSRGELSDLASLREGDHVTVVARVELAEATHLPPRGGKGPQNRLKVVVTDDTDRLTLMFFYQVG